MRYVVLLAALLALLAVACGGQPAPTASPAAHRPSPTPEEETLAFIRDGDIWAIGADGDGQRRLFDSPPGEGVFDFAWSPDGERIAFSSGPSVNGNIYVMDAGGANVSLLTDDPEHDTGPAWSPDGSRLVFVRFNQDLTRQLLVVNADGSGLSSLVEAGDPIFAHAWTPDGARVAFISGYAREEGGLKKFSYEVFTVSTDGSGPAPITDQLAHTEREGLSFTWSPDGTRIAAQGVVDFNSDIVVFGADGSGLVNLATDPASDTEPVWSPDSSRIAFLSTRDGDWEIYVISPDGSGLTNLTNNDVQDGLEGFSWSPDGSRLAFASDQDQHIYLVSADGADLTQLTEGSQPAWQPRP